MERLISHDTAEGLNGAARKATRGRVATRILMIRDVQSGMLRKSVCARYGVTPGTLCLWVGRYNREGLAGLSDKPRSGAPCKLTTAQQQELKERVEKQPDSSKDGTLVRWRVCDVQRLLQKEFKVEYNSEQGVARLLKSLGLVRLTTRPSHPKKKEEDSEEFKKNSPFC
jgi:transposase